MAPFWSEPFDASNKAAYLAAKRLTLILVTINIFFCAIGFVEMDWGSDQPTSIPIHVCHGIVAAIGLMMFSKVHEWSRGSKIIKLQTKKARI